MIWLNDELSERARLNAIKAATITDDCPEGLDLTRGICNGRFGWPARAEIREIWLNGGQSERKRLDLVEALAGKRPARGVMHARYGNPSNPKPLEDDE